MKCVDQICLYSEISEVGRSWVNFEPLNLQCLTVNQSSLKKGQPSREAARARIVSCDFFSADSAVSRAARSLDMEEYFFNVDNGYLEGLVRGFRSGILTRTDYINLVQCETVEGIILETIRPRAVHGGGGGGGGGGAPLA